MPYHTYNNIRILEQCMYKNDQQQGYGFLITCDKNKQKQAVKDAYNFLNQYIQDIYGDVQTTIIHKQLEKLGREANLQNQMDIRAKMKNKIRILSNVETNVNCLVFIKINQSIPVKIEPYKVVHKLMQDIHKQGRQVTRFCHKILPIQRSFKAQHFKMLDQIDLMFQKRDNSEKKSWALDFKCRNNSKFNYKQVLTKSEEIIKKYQHFVDIYYPQWTVIVHVVHHLMCLAVLEDYKLFEQYRLHKKGTKINNHSFNDKKQSIKQKKIEKQQKLIYSRQKQKNKQQNNDKQQNNQKQNKQYAQVQKQEQGAEPADPHKNSNQNQKNNKEQQQKVNKLLEEKIGVNNDDDIDFI